MLRDNKEDGFSPGSMLHLWTAQTDAVLDCIRENGFSQVKMEFIDKKYEESAWVFKEAYGFFKQRARLMVKPPEGAESPVWLFFDPGWCICLRTVICWNCLFPGNGWCCLTVKGGRGF